MQRSSTYALSASRLPLISLMSACTAAVEFIKASAYKRKYTSSHSLSPFSPVKENHPAIGRSKESREKFHNLFKDVLS